MYNWRKNINTILLIFIVNLVSAQSDSLIHELNQLSDNSSRLKTLYKKSLGLKYSDPQKALEYLQFGRANYFDNVHDSLIAAHYKWKSLYFAILGEFTESEKAADTAILMYNQTGSMYDLGYCYNIIGVVNGEKGNYNKALQYYLKCTNIYDSLNLKSELANPLSNIGSIYYKTGKWETALQYYHKVLSIKRSNQNKQGTAISYSNIGVTYKALKKLDSAVFYYSKALDLYNETNDLQGRSLTNSALGTIYRKTGKTQLAKKHLLEAIKDQETLGEKHNLVYSRLGLAQTLLLQKEYDDALSSAKKAIILAGKIGAKKEQFEVYETIAEIFEQKEAFDSAYHYHKLYSQMKDSVYNLESSRQLTEMETKYETEKKEQENIALRHKAEADQKEKENQQIILFAAILIGLLILTFAIIIFNRLKITRKQKIQIEETNEELNQINEEIMSQRDQIEVQKNLIEEKHNEIHESINYAKRIQTAILPPNSLLKQHLPEHFVFYKPKDVVAGDFYWMETIGNFIFLAVADCTGHGVPGAMVSVVCHSALNRCVREYKLVTPSEILDKTRDLVINTFAKSEEQVHDGMDISLIALNSQKGTIQFAGAHNPLYILKKNSELEIIKADKQPIGYFQNPAPFTNHDLSVEKGDKLYLFSDGFADQFGGPNGKKYSYKAFREFLIKYSTSPIETMHTILDEEFKHWKGSEEQIDDVCIIGVKI